MLATTADSAQFLANWPELAVLPSHPGFEPTPQAGVKQEPFVTHAGDIGSNPGVAKV